MIWKWFKKKKPEKKPETEEKAETHYTVTAICGNCNAFSTIEIPLGVPARLFLSEDRAKKKKTRVDCYNCKCPIILRKNERRKK